jgi:ATP-dependent RNA helicase DeaD
LICRYGHVGRGDIGAIRIAANESYFEVTARATPGFVKALRRATIAAEDDGMVIELAPPRSAEEAARPRGKPQRPGKARGPGLRQPAG